MYVRTDGLIDGWMGKADVGGMGFVLFVLFALLTFGLG
jgi:hypothetical protein